MKDGHIANYKMQVFVSGGNKLEVDWTANVHHNSQKTANEMIIIAKNNQKHE